MLKCQFCKKDFKYLSVLQAHIAIRHPIEKAVL